MLVRSFFKESSGYGFQQVDYIRFVNMLLDISMTSPASIQAHAQDSSRIPERRSEAGNYCLPLVGKNLDIREFDRKIDADTIEHWLSEKQGMLFLLSSITAKAADFKQLSSIDTNKFGMIVDKSGEPIGCMAFLNIDNAQRKAELRKLIGNPRMRGRGFAKEAARLWIDYGLSALKLKKIYLTTLDTNIGNIKLNEDIGFNVEGILQNEILLDGEYRDVLRMGLWND